MLYNTGTTETTMTDFICAYFGGDQTGITWTITARGFVSPKQAEKHGLYMMPMAGCFGFAVIAEDDNMWTLREDLSILPDNFSIGQDELNGYKVDNAKKLEFV